MKKFMMAALVVLAMSFASCTGNACGAGTDDTTDTTEAVVDSLGEEFLNYVKDGMTITIKEDGVVEVTE